MRIEVGQRTWKAITGAVMASALAMAAPAPASAVSCWGDWCSGRDPVATGCSADAYTVAHVQLPAVIQRLELRWSPRCKTNWARLTYDPYPSWIRAVQPSTGYTRYFSGRSAWNSWSAMIYSPFRCVYAQAQTRTWGRYTTVCI